MRKGIIIAVSLLSGLLAACGNQGGNTTKTSSSHSTSKVATSKSSAGKMAAHPAATSQHHAKTATSLWNQQKGQQLATFMDSWGTTMKQQYDSYDQDNDTNFYGLKYPADFHKNNLMANDQAASFAWSKTGKGTADYEVVAIYSDVEHTKSMGAHLYLFTLHAGQPVVLYSGQNQGNEENKVYFKTTDNTDLANGFSKIINGQKTTTATPKAHQSTTTKSATPQPYNIDAAMRGNWYAVDKDGKMSQVTFTAHTEKTHFAGETPGTISWYLDDGSDPDDKSNIHDWGRVMSTTYHRDGTTFFNVLGWNQAAGDGAYYGIKQEKVDGRDVPVLIEAGGAGLWCDAVYYQTATLAKQQGARHFSDIDYGD